MEESAVREGYLVLADISGYTSFLTGNELEHANGIIEDLTASLIASLGPPLQFVKVEGDAVLVYAERRALESGERVLEILERCYVAFGDRINDMRRTTTCRCSACANIATLDLKFVAHLGSFIVQRTAGQVDVAGPDVILVHRLLKNRVVEATGIRAYILLTEMLAGAFTHPLELAAHEESYESFGTVRGLVEDLAPVASALREARRVRVAPDEADITVTLQMAVPPAVAWDWWVSPDLFLRWMSGTTAIDAEANGAGRTGVGALNHCAHGRGRALERFVDWRPFEYYTQELEPVRWSPTTPPRCRVTVEFAPRDDGSVTDVTFRAQLVSPGALQRAAAPLMRRSLVKSFARAERRFAELLAGASPLGS